MSKRIGYIRVSTVDQNPERQLENIPLDKKFIDYSSGKSINRPELVNLLNYVRDDDIVYVHSMDRLARNVKDLRKIIDNLNSQKVKIHFLKENLMFTGDDSPISNLLLNIMGAIAEFEHALIVERIREGVLIAKKAGKYKGRKKSFDDHKLELLKTEIFRPKCIHEQKSMAQLARDFRVSRNTLYKYLKQITNQ